MKKLITYSIFLFCIGVINIILGKVKGDYYIGKLPDQRVENISTSIIELLDSNNLDPKKQEYLQKGFARKEMYEIAVLGGEIFAGIGLLGIGIYQLLRIYRTSHIPIN